MTDKKVGVGFIITVIIVLILIVAAVYILIGTGPPFAPAAIKEGRIVDDNTIEYIFGPGIDNKAFDYFELSVGIDGNFTEPQTIIGPGEENALLFTLGTINLTATFFDVDMSSTFNENDYVKIESTEVHISGDIYSVGLYVAETGSYYYGYDLTVP